MLYKERQQARLLGCIRSHDTSFDISLCGDIIFLYLCFMVKDLEDLELVANKVQDELKTYVYANRKEEFEVKDFLEVYNSDTSKKSEEFIEKSKERHPEREDFEFIRDVLFPLVSDVEEMKECIQITINQKFSSFKDYEVVGDIFKRKVFPPLKFKLSVPSGKIVADDSLRDSEGNRLFKDMERFELSNIEGITKTTEAYIKKGMAHGIVGNSCPSLFWDESENTLHIGTERTEESNYEEAVNPNLKNVGFICTDLWWYSIMDYDLFIKSGGVLEKVDNVIEIPAGEYEFEHYTEITKFGWDIDCHAIMKKIG
jgi:hypothetical protein